MKKDVNFIFFGLLLLLMIAMAGVMLYSDYTYHKVNGDYIRFKQMYDQAQDDLNVSKEEIRTKQLELEDLERNMTDLWNELQLSKTKGASIQQFYVNVSTQKQQLSQNLSRALSDIDRCRSDYETSRLTLSVCQRDIQLREKERDTYKASLMPYQAAVADAAMKLEQIMEDMDSIRCSNRTKCSADVNNITARLETLQAKLDQMN